VSEGVLESLGFDQTRRQEISDLGATGICGRVVRVDRSVATVLSADGVQRVETSPSDELVVGDWVMLSNELIRRLSRRTELVRRVGANKDERQSMAANIDLVLIVRALDTEVRVNRLMSLAVVAYDSGATPLVVLTKADVCDDVPAAIEKVSIALGAVETVAISAKNGLGLVELRERIKGRTIVLFGESGAGKSTLTNILCGQELLATGEVRRDGQGRHTTTHRELVVVPSGGVIIDTPGIREAASFGEGHGIDLAFADVVAFARKCQFSDCSHLDTPGCAVNEALAQGLLIKLRVEAYLHELEQQQWLETRQRTKAESNEQKPTYRRRGGKGRG
jgi:ribosome biogenesis GTPase